MDKEQQLQELIEFLRLTTKAWREQKPTAKHLKELALVQQQIREGKIGEEAVYELIDSSLKRLDQFAPEQAKLLRMRWEGAAMPKVADKIHRSPGDLFKQEKAALTTLASVIEQQESALRQQRRARWQRVLPPASYTRVVGAEARMQALLPHFKEKDAPWLVALVGMGGIGKTTLAHALASEMIESARFENLAWVSAQQVVLSLDGTMEFLSDTPALTLEALVSDLGWQLMGRSAVEWRVPAYEKVDTVLEHLTTHPNLVVVDNLETAEDVEKLLPFLQKARGQSKFLLTSRLTPARHGDIHIHSVPPLTFEETLALIQQEAKSRHLTTLRNCDPVTAERIFDHTGGNPLALRLVLGQIDMYGLSPVLEQLRSIQGTSELLYRYLYNWVWQTLDEQARTVLKALLVLTPENSDAARLQSTTDLPLATVQSALQQLLTRNLVILDGNLDERRYLLHNLTRAYLEEVNRSSATTRL